MGNPKQQRPNRVWHLKTFLRWGSRVYSPLCDKNIITDLRFQQMLDISKNIVWPSDIPEDIVLYPTSFKNTRLFQWSYHISPNFDETSPKNSRKSQNSWWNLLARTRRRPIKRGRRCFKNLFPHIVRHSRDSMRKQSSAIYIQMNFCGSYSFVCEYGLPQKVKTKNIPKFQLLILMKTGSGQI